MTGTEECVVKLECRFENSEKACDIGAPELCVIYLLEQAGLNFTCDDIGLAHAQEKRREFLCDRRKIFSPQSSGNFACLLAARPLFLRGRGLPSEWTCEVRRSWP